MPAATTARTQTSPVLIKRNGAPLPPAEVEQVLDVTIEQDLVLPDAFTIRLHDTSDQLGRHEFTHAAIVDADSFPVGGVIEILLGREAAPQKVLSGEITSLELDVSLGSAGSGPPRVTVRGYDKAYRLHRARKSRTFVNVSDSDLVRTVAQEYGLTVQCDPTPAVYPHIYQHNQTDWEFLRTRAVRLGFELRIVDQKLYFRKPAPSGQPHDLELGTSLYRVRVRLAAPHQVQEVTVKGWDPKTKREIVGTASRASHGPAIGEGRTGAQLSATLGRGAYVVADPQVATQGEAEVMAGSIFDEIAGEFIQLEGTCLGDPQLRPGQPVKLKNVGRRFDGTYYLTAVTHKVNQTDGYLCQFTVSGRRPATLAALLAAPSPGQSSMAATANGKAVATYPGVVVGIVTNNKPPADQLQGQVKVKFPWLAQDESAWARLATPMAGAGRGFYFVPEVDDEVLVAFEQGDINRPYVVGGLWNGKDVPPKPAADVVDSMGKVNQRIIKSRTGHTVTLDDSADNPSITIVDQTGKNLIKLESKTNKLTAHVEGDMLLEASNTVTIKGRTVDVQANDDLKMKGMTSSLEGTQTMNVKGNQATFEGTATVNVKGAQGTVEGSAVLEVKGGVVKIN